MKEKGQKVKKGLHTSINQNDKHVNGQCQQSFSVLNPVFYL